MALSRKQMKEQVLKRVRYDGSGKPLSFEERPFDENNFTTCSPGTSGELIWKAVMGK